MSDHLEQAAVRAVELASELVNTGGSTIDLAAAQHLTYLAGLIRGGADQPLATGRCGSRMHAIGDRTYFCHLPAGHKGWHEGEGGVGWSEEASTGREVEELADLRADLWRALELEPTSDADLIATVRSLRHDERTCDCRGIPRQVCDVCQGVTGDEKDVELSRE